MFSSQQNRGWTWHLPHRDGCCLLLRAEERDAVRYLVKALFLSNASAARSSFVRIYVDFHWHQSVCIYYLLYLMNIDLHYRSPEYLTGFQAPMLRYGGRNGFTPPGIHQKLIRNGFMDWIAGTGQTGEDIARNICFTLYTGLKSWWTTFGPDMTGKF